MSTGCWHGISALKAVHTSSLNFRKWAASVEFFVCVHTSHPVLSPQVCADPRARRRPHFPCLSEADGKPIRVAHSTVAMVTLVDTPPFVQGQIMEAFSANTNTENALHPVTHTWNVERSTSEKMRNRLNLPSKVNSLWFFLDCKVHAFIFKGNCFLVTNTSDWVTELTLCLKPDWRQYYFTELDVLTLFPLNMTHSMFPSQKKIYPRRST